MGKCRISNHHCLKVIRIAGFVALLLPLLFVQKGLAQQRCNGTPTIGKWVYPTSVESGDPVSVIVRVAGCSGQVAQPIPFDGVLLIDMSNSMDDDWPRSDPRDLRLDAAISFVDCVAPETRLALVTFSDIAELVQELTSDKETLRSKINELRGDAHSWTNMYGAMQIAQQHLIDVASDEREKLIILLTDGRDNSGHTDMEFFDLLDVAIDNDIRYVTIALGPDTDYFVLRTFADSTGGTWHTSAAAEELAGVYHTICQYASHLASTRDITLEEILSPGIRVVPGSVTSDIEGLEGQIGQFETAGHITADLGTLGDGEGRFISFQVVSDCLTPDSEEESIEASIDAPSSKVTYIFGLSRGEVVVPTRTFTCTRPGDLRALKEYDPFTSVLSITLESRYLPGAAASVIHNITVIERPSIYFQARLPSASPPTDLVFPEAKNSDVGNTDVLVWKIPALGPREIKTLAVQLDPTVCSTQYLPPIDVNADKYTGGWPGEITYVRPNGTSNTIPMPFYTASLPTMESCDGRADIGILPAYSFGEYINPPDVSPQYVLFKDESSWIWVDSYQNGSWDGSATNVGDFIRGATLSNVPGASVTDRIQVPGQGDLFNLNSTNVIMARVVNSGSKPATDLLQGAILYVYNHTTSRWDVIRSETLPAINPEMSQLVKFSIPANSLQPDLYVRPYALAVGDAMKVISVLNPGFAGRIRSWANDHPAQWSTLVGQGELVPQDLVNVLPSCPWYNPFCLFTGTALREEYRTFLGRNGSTMAWGKPVLKAKIEVKGPDSEKHTNNNSSSELIIVSQ